MPRMLKRLFNGGGGEAGEGGVGVFSAGALISCLNGAVDSGLAQAAVQREQDRLWQLRREAAAASDPLPSPDTNMRRSCRVRTRNNSGYDTSDLSSDSEENDGKHL